MGFAGSFENVHEPADAIAAFPGALGAFDAEHVELAVDVAEDETSPGHLALPVHPAGNLTYPTRCTRRKLDRL